MSTTPPASTQTAPDPETITDTSTSAIAPRAATGNTPSSLATAIAERDQYDDARKAQFLGFRRWLVPSLFAVTVVWLVFVGGKATAPICLVWLTRCQYPRVIIASGRNHHGSKQRWY